MEEFRKDIEIAINIWQDLLNSFFQDDLEYVYVKGSAMKPWKSMIDYVPQISDVDIHVKLKDSNSELLKHPSLEIALQFGHTYQKLFKKENEQRKRKYSHLPRIQLVVINKLKLSKENFVYPRLQDVHVLVGNPIFPTELSFDFVRKSDNEELLQIPKVIAKANNDLVDRSDSFEYYIVLRRINFVISPSPVRLLTQLLIDENPYDIWVFNRSTIKEKLESLSLNELASTYERYYLAGWKLFTSKFMDTNKFINVLSLGQKVLELVYNEVVKSG